MQRADGLTPEQEDPSFLDFLEAKHALKGHLKDTVAFAAALSNTTDAATLPALQRIRKYLGAVGRFGRSPFLLAQYGGIGEIIQGFCR